MKQLFSDYGIEIQEDQITRFKRFYDLLINWNQKMNLTTITDYDEVIKKHFLDSCLLLKNYSKEFFFEKKMIDVGTGAGFPGIPLSIFLPNTEFTLMDSLQKRIDFLSIVVKELGLKNITLIHGRAEDFGRNECFREQFDFCVSRAVAALPLLLEYCSPFIKIDGKLLLYKSRKTSQEIEEAEHALHVLECEVLNCIELADEIDFQRYLLEINKCKSTPEKYPRKPGKPKKNPL